MMRVFRAFFIILLQFTQLGWLYAEEPKTYGRKICLEPGYRCLNVQRGDSWTSLFPDDKQRDLVRRINRMNIFLQPDMVIAVPKNLEEINIFDISPFPRYISSQGEKIVIIDLGSLAWAAYNAEGELRWWGPVSPGFSSDPSRETPTGHYRILRKQDSECVSGSYPKRLDHENGGARMPYCMYFYKGYALHGSAELPGYAASEGCVRLFTEDAKWLNENFAIQKGTRVEVVSDIADFLSTKDNV